ncbi:MAG: hypothetical protein JRI95_10810 [Deltaproteobacteria bacterium]|nr:hypothetical protein [Deltaproteobacteria bacterium]
MSGSENQGKVAVVGGGRAFKQLLKALEALDNDHEKGMVLEIAAVADVNPEAPGMEYARQKGIQVFTDYREMIGMEGLEIVIELTGKQEVCQALRKELPPQVSLMDHRTARIIWDLIGLGEARLSLIRKETHAQRLAAVEEMATYIAHEIRNPLMSLGGYTQRLITMDCLKGEDCLRRTRIIVEEARRLEAVLHNIWDMTRPLEINVELADFNQIVRDSVELLRPDREKAGVEVHLSQEPDIPPALFDPYLIKQACLNIIKNAIESMPRGGKTAISTEIDRDHLLFRCIDYGFGIKKEDLSHVFNPFFSTKKGALGLGLAMAKKIIEDHDGEIRVTAREGKGTAVEFRLPRQQP